MLPTYDKTKRRQSYEPLPKGAYVIEVKAACEDPNKSGSGSHLTIAFDIAEGPFKGFYQQMFDRNSSEDRAWPRDGVFYLNIPGDGSASYVWDTWNTFFADLEDSNNGFIFKGDVRTLKGKKLGGKFYIEQSAGKDGTVYDHVRLKWSCVADDVRNGRPGRMPKDKLLSQAPVQAPEEGDIFGDNADSNFTSATDFVSIPDGIDEELPFI
jgi:hypothetical protein